MENKYNTKITTEERKAVKEHRCSLCGSKIEVGEVYTFMDKATLANNTLRAWHKSFKLCLLHHIKKIEIVKNKVKEITDE